MSDKRSLSRRRFVAGASAGLLLAGGRGRRPPERRPADSGKLAIEGGEKAVKMPAGARARAGASPSVNSSMRCSSKTRFSIGKDRRPNC